MFGVTVVATNLKTHLAAGTQTDSMGVFRFYKLPVGEKYSFSFSSVGFLPQTLSGYNIKAGASIDILVKLKDQNSALSEVVVVGYGTQRRADVTGAVSQVSGEVLENRSLPNVSQGLQGTVAGLNLVMQDGKPIQSPVFNIREIGRASCRERV